MRQLTNPKFSVITVSYNQGEFIRDNIESVLKQNYQNFEHIVVDGGSTDNTVEVLKSYPHLKWTSEPDRGQTHALNKGFSRASGDIIAWLNSDDWYPENIFSGIAAALENAPLVMGACQLTDRNGKFTEYVPNIGRNWFDILKYWIFFSSPSQPSIFFRRDILEEVKRPDGTYLDEELDYCMDYEFWLRVAQKYPLNNWIEKTFSYYRNYESNKTGMDMASVYREMSRVYNRYCNIMSVPEKRLSFVMPTTEVNAALRSSIESISKQMLLDQEVVVVDYGDAANSKQLRKAVVELDRTFPTVPIRYARSVGKGLFGALNSGFRSACAPLVAFIEPGTIINPGFSFEVSHIFQQDVFGIILPERGNGALGPHLAREQNGQKMVDLEAVFRFNRHPVNFIARKVALMELGELRHTDDDIMAFRELLLRLVYNGWQMNLGNQLEIHTSEKTLSPLEQGRNDRMNSRLIVDIEEAYLREPFGQLRIKNGFGIRFPAGLVENARQILK